MSFSADIFTGSPEFAFPSGLHCIADFGNLTFILDIVRHLLISVIVFNF